MGEHKRGYLSPRDTLHHTLKESPFAVPPKPLEIAPGGMATFSFFVPRSSSPNFGNTPRRNHEGNDEKRRSSSSKPLA